MTVINTLPKNAQDFRQAIYDGSVFVIKATPESMVLVKNIQDVLNQHFNIGNTLEQAHIDYSKEELWDKLSQARKDITSDTDFSRQFIKPIISPYFNENALFDVLRLRCSPHNGFLNPAAANSLTAHRDTWYANPQAQINFWIPLFDVEERQGFRFYPSYFNKAVKNNSGDFDYNSWSKNIGFQSSRADNQAVYPSTQETIDDPSAFSFSCMAGDIVIFAASHLHQPCLNDSGKTRFSVDFRVVDQSDRLKGLGAPNIDNHAKGSASKDYFRL